MGDYVTFAKEAHNQSLASDIMNENTIIFEDIYSKNYLKVVFVANSYVNDMGEAENIAQNVFAALWKNFNNVSREKAAGYLFATTKNMCLNLLKRHTFAQKYNTYRSKTDYLNMMALEADTDYTCVYEKELHRIIGEGMNMMKEKVRRTFLLSRINGLKNREIAKIEGVTESAIEARISSALLLMRKLLRDYLL